jgi:V/A-type H+-transporting ATPase subunit K
MNPAYEFKRKVILSLIVIMVLMGVSAVIPVHRLAAAETAEAPAGGGNGTAIGLIAAALAFGFGALGAGMAIGNVGSAAMGAIAEKPELASQALIFIALAEGLVVFGFITALMILGRV